MGFYAFAAGLLVVAVPVVAWVRAGARKTAADPVDPLASVLVLLGFVLATLLAYPVAETGMSDDFSYIRSAQALAQTGHLHYVGWASATLGWQLAIGALFIKLFGFSFTAVRASNEFVAALTALLLHRILLRAGVAPRNALFGALTFILSPLFLTSALSFMTDLGGLFAVLLCLYACLRALAARKPAASILWLSAAALSNDVGGTVRQIAWLGALVMVPCTAYLLRRRPRVLLAGVFLTAVSAAFIALCVLWANRQPYMLPESLLLSLITPRLVAWLGLGYVRSVFDLTLFLLPILLVFLPRLPWRRPAARLGVLFTGLYVLGVFFVHTRRSGFFIAPFLGNDVTPWGLVDATILHSQRPLVIPVAVQLVLAALTLLCLLAFLLRTPADLRSPSNAPLTRNQFTLLTGPFLLAYFLLLAPRGAIFTIFDRYLLIPFAFALLFVLRQLPRALPRVTWLPIALFAAFAVAGLHDTFSIYRARLEAAGELVARGVPRTAIDGGFEYNGWTQFLTTGYLNDADIRLPRDAFHAVPAQDERDPCLPQLHALTPAVDARFGLAYTPAACAGPTGLPPATFHPWLALHPMSVFSIRLHASPAGGAQGTLSSIP